jgi:hypothetical protein
MDAMPLASVAVGAKVTFAKGMEPLVEVVMLAGHLVTGACNIIANQKEIVE